jgi:anthranilate phosphoribosyltransferase
LVTAGTAQDIRAGINLAAQAIDSGATSKTLAALVEFGKQAR